MCQIVLHEYNLFILNNYVKYIYAINKFKLYLYNICSFMRISFIECCVGII